MSERHWNFHAKKIKKKMTIRHIKTRSREDKLGQKFVEQSPQGDPNVFKTKGQTIRFS